jgi:quinol monooxygenase YgiN
MIFIVTKNRARRKFADDWVSLVEDFTTATRAEPGNLFFDWYRSVDDPTVYVLVEAFADHAAGEAHVNSDHFQAATVVLSEAPSRPRAARCGTWRRSREATAIWPARRGPSCSSESSTRTRTDRLR